MSRDNLPKDFDPNDLKAKKLRQQDDDLRLQRSARSAQAKKLREAAKLEREKLKKETQSKAPKATKVKTTQPKAKKPQVERPKANQPSTESSTSKIGKSKITTKANDIVNTATSIKNLKSEITMSRYDKFVEKVNSIKDIKQLKKMIYNRNYNVKKNYMKDNPGVENLKHIIINDMRHIKQTTFDRVAAIKDNDKQLDVLRKLLIDNTRRKNRPKFVEDYSNREQDYMGNSIFSLQSAINSWGDDNLRSKVQEGLDNLSLDDIKDIFTVVPSYWAISEGYYYAVADFSAFMDEILRLINRGLDEKDQLSGEERRAITENLFKNTPEYT